MKFEPSPLKDAWIVSMDPIRDERGYFSRTFCQREFAEHGLPCPVAQCNVSFNKLAGTLRGMHYQREPSDETKLVRCVGGRVYDVIVDLRPGSPTHMQCFGIELSQDNLKALFVPANFAHGFLTLEDDSEVFYMMGDDYAPARDGGMRFDDPKLGIKWPSEPVVVSEKDRSWPLL
ncbi:MAG: dTDP-4-dehydrorhamnose 3,5-epimerase [Verrucomicrobiota bacterium]